ncbi:MAG: hypothetical protein AB7F76_05365 [Parvibaculaceae bacterium]|jgi:hypothetical protein
MFIRLLFIFIVGLLIALALRGGAKAPNAPPALKTTYQVLLFGSLGFIGFFSALFLILHLFGYRF